MEASTGVLANLTVVGNLARLNSTASGALRASGGGVFCSAPATIRNIVITGNRAWGHGRATGSTVLAAGGGCYQVRASRWANVVLTRNLASASGLGSLVRSRGGGLYANTTATLSKVNMTGNTALVSGTAVTTLALASGEFSHLPHVPERFITNVTLDAHAVLFSGGGIFAVGPLVNISAIRLVTNTANQSGLAAAASMGAGGGVYLNRSCRVEAAGGSSLFLDNRAVGSYQRFGGAGYVSRGSR